MKVATVREIEATLLKETACLETKAMGRRTKHKRNTLTSFVIGLIGSLSARSVVNLLLLSWKKRGKKRKGRLPPCRS